MKVKSSVRVGLLTTSLLIASFTTVQAVDLSSLATSVARGPQSKESVYFVMTDRFANGSTANDNGGLSGSRYVTGFDPNDSGWWHGGDFKGLTEHLGYIKNLGFTAIWITPPVKQQYVQGESAAYHGYWGVDFTTIDPHLGTEADFKAFVSGAHQLGMKVIIDVVANHTADVIRYKLDSYGYRDTTEYPYKTSAGIAFDATKYAGSSTFPQLSAATSFAYVPEVAPPDATIKKPAWLNDLTNYHNRGNSTFEGESSLDGDFYGLDDLFTEKPEVVKGWTSVWSDWITKFNIDGLRIDTFRHVNPEFWKAVLPQVLAVAKSAGKKDFPIFGEVADSDPFSLATYVSEHQTPSVLDFAFQASAANYAKGVDSIVLANLFNADDAYTTSSTSAYGLATFMGNHDMGRIGMMLAQTNGDSGDAALLQRAELANSLLFLLRGGPVLYYGDEKGMTGSDGDKAAREDMFATQVNEWQTEQRIGTDPVGDKSSFDLHDPLEDQIKALQAAIKANPALRNGTQQTRYAGASIYVATRYSNNQEYVVAFNSADVAQTATFPVSTKSSTWVKLLGTDASMSSSNQRMKLTLPGRSYILLKASSKFSPQSKVAIQLQTPSIDYLSPRWIALTATVPGDDYNEVTFATRAAKGSWQVVGTSDRRTFKTDDVAGGLYRVYLHPIGYKNGTTLEVVAIAKGMTGKKAVSSVKKYTIHY